MTAPRADEPFYGPRKPERHSRRLLLVSWHFPPANTTGALRWQRLAPFAEDEGWGLDVITRDPDSVDRVEWSRMDELPPDTRVFAVPRRPSVWEGAAEWISASKRKVGRLFARSTEVPPVSRAAADRAPSRPDEPDPGLVSRSEARWRLTSLLGWKRAMNAWVEDSRLRPWARDASALGCRIVSADAHRAVISCGPPHGVHEAARRIAETTGIGLAIDLRDPWSLVRAVQESFGSPLAFHLNDRAERATIERADLVVCNTEALMIAMRAAHPASDVTFVTARNGCDLAESLPSNRSRRFVVAYAGAIYIDRDPRPLFAAARRVIRDGGLDPDGFGIEMMGDVETFGGVPLRRLAGEAGVERYLRLHSPGSRGEALGFLSGASLLVSLPQSAHLSIPSKIYEYMQFQAWMLALAERGSATELLLRGSAADVVEPDDVDGIERVLRERLTQHRNGVKPPRLSEDPRFSRESEARILFDAIGERFG